MSAGAGVHARALLALLALLAAQAVGATRAHADGIGVLTPGVAREPRVVNFGDRTVGILPGGFLGPFLTYGSVGVDASQTRELRAATESTPLELVGRLQALLVAELRATGVDAVPLHVLRSVRSSPGALARADLPEDRGTGVLLDVVVNDLGLRALGHDYAPFLVVDYRVLDGSGRIVSLGRRVDHAPRCESARGDRCSAADASCRFDDLDAAGADLPRLARCMEAGALAIAARIAADLAPRR